jgi:putative membrane protein
MADQQLFAKKPFSLVNALKGLTIGMANIIPGVSGGTIAVITGIYDELVDAFGNFFSSEGGWRRNLSFLAPVILGILIGNIALARLVGYLLETAPGPTNFGFIGLILGSTPYLVKRAGRQTLRPRYLLLFAAGLAVVLWMGLAPRPDAAEPIREVTLASGALILVAAFVASIAMIIPGVSGSFLLLLIGIYSTMQVGFSTLNLPVIGIFVVGTIAGVVLVSKVIATLLRRFHGSTYAVVIGLVVGSVIAIYPGFSEGSLIFVDVAAFIAGALLSLTLGTSMKERILKTRRT